MAGISLAAFRRQRHRYSFGAERAVALLGQSKNVAEGLVDPGVVDPSGSTSIGWFAPSLDGKRVAVSLAKAGAETGDVHVFDVATGKDGTDAVPQADGSGSGDCLAWKADGRNC